MSNNNDYGHFGKGSTGYAHYDQAFKSNFPDKKGGGGGKPPSNNGGCLNCIIVMVMIGTVISYLVR